MERNRCNMLAFVSLVWISFLNLNTASLIPPNTLTLQHGMLSDSHHSPLSGILGEKGSYEVVFVAGRSKKDSLKWFVVE